MKLLFDQNLSPRLPRALSDLYPDSAHVREAGLRDSSDEAIWNYAKQNDFTIVSKDSDFQRAFFMAVRRNSFGCASAIARQKQLKMCCDATPRRFTHSSKTPKSLT